MPNCLNCTNFQTTLKEGNLCGNCFSLRSITTQSNSDASTMDGSTFDEKKSSDTQLPNNSLLDIMVAGIISIIEKVNEKLEMKFRGMHEDSNARVRSLAEKVTKLEAECAKQQEKIDALTESMVRMQISSNNSDNNIPTSHVVIFGLPEDDISLPNERLTLKNDREKVGGLMKEIGCKCFTEGATENVEITRLGIPHLGNNRVTKMKLASEKDRDKILEKSTNLQCAKSPWRTVYIKKEFH